MTMSHVDKIRNAQRHERLRELMSAKVEKLVKGTLNEQQREFIRHEVDLLIHNGDASESSLHRVAASLRVFASKPQQPLSAQPKGSRSSDTGSKRPTPEPSNVAHRVATASHEEDSATRRRELPSETYADDVWAKLCKRDAEEYTKEILEHRKLLKRKEEEQRHFLEAQVSRRTEMKQRQVEEERQVAQREHEQVKQWQIEEMKKKEEVKRRFAAERQLRDEQLKIAHEKKMKEEAARREEDARQAEMIREALKKEEEANEIKKLHAKEEVVKFQAINKMHEDAKQRVREREAEMDKEHQRLFLERLAKQERERDEALAKMHEKQRHQHAMASQMQASVSEKAAEDERKAKEYAAKKEQQHMEEEQRKAQKQAQEKTKIKQYLSMQIVEREHQRSEERQKMLTMREQLKKEVEAAERAEYERHLRHKQKQEYQRKLLEDQMEEKSHTRPTFMSDEERRLNARLIDKALTPTPSRR